MFYYDVTLPLVHEWFCMFSLRHVGDYFLLHNFLFAGQVKLAVHAMRLCQIRVASDSNDDIKSHTLVALLCLLEGPIAFNNIFLRHYLFCILQILGGRCKFFSF